MIKIKQGLDLPITGRPEQIIKAAAPPTSVALLGIDYAGLKPHLEVQESDTVRKGQVLFSDKRFPSVIYTSPGTGTVTAINRGERRALLSVVIELTDSDEQVQFQSYSDAEIATLPRQTVIEQLLASGQWTALRSRPFDKVADPEIVPHSIFITAIDSNPLAPAIAPILQGHEQDLLNGLRLLSTLTDGKLFLCKAPETHLPDIDLAKLVIEDFSGPHPAGNAGTHIHFLDPVSLDKTVCHVGLQDVIAIGKLFSSGNLYTDRVVALAGPSALNPRLIKTRVGAGLEDLCAGELIDGEQRIISGSVLSGHTASGATAYLGRFHQQVSLLPEDRKRQFLGWLGPGLNRHSVKPVFLSRFLPDTRFDFTTAKNGEVRAILPSGNFEKIMPLDIMPLFLLRALAVEDIEEAEALGCLELAEEDLALCAYVCPSKLEFGPLLRKNLDLIEAQSREET
ncbi:Na(+)-translocating NADH-quinone reductase subunit A [Methylomarinum sp. Ch1-1]|uniref:Na(+)-translocating NADH-quinone reductase subunit A n=1 Tax=Methylomarinum roseum TaxID=3067653 RepID=A0AAU7NX84_9GAMM|nr:Na(+)-translocating NADH-quinone reductase subunit A [Methylomarinum sp. Ch1-1]MDP4522315.1 Na(+)-translocating NADH-quinone reductase subunit A [Methylomarinum sp. Ch1-1]